MGYISKQSSSSKPFPIKNQVGCKARLKVENSRKQKEKENKEDLYSRCKWGSERELLTEFYKA